MVQVDSSPQQPKAKSQPTEQSNKSYQQQEEKI